MKETVVDIKNRRSVKEYQKKQITDEELMQVLEAGMNAPSGGNRQPAIFIVVQNKEWIDKLCVLNAKIAGAHVDSVSRYFLGTLSIINIGDFKKGMAMLDGRTKSFVLLYNNTVII